MTIGLIDVDGKLPNLALMKISTYYKSMGEQVEFAKKSNQYERLYASAIFPQSKEKCQHLLDEYGGEIEIGGTGWDIKKRLPRDIESCKADYNLYTTDIIASRTNVIGSKEYKLKKAAAFANAGLGFTSRGCVNNCPFCFVPAKEGYLKQDQEIKDIINPRSNLVILQDNNLSADPYHIEKLNEIRDRKLIVDLNQGIDIRMMNEDTAKALSEVKHFRSIHYAWDLMQHEKQVVDGITLFSKFVKPYRQMCYVLVGFNTCFEEDMYRFKKLVGMGVLPFVMIYNRITDTRLKHFARWVNARIYKKCPFEEYVPWIKAKPKYDALGGSRS